MGANLSILASLMQQAPAPVPQYNPMEEAQSQALLQGRRQGNETSLLQLGDIKRQQEAEAQVMLEIQRNPALAAQLFGGSTLASLPTTGGPPAGPGAGPLTQQPFGPGGVGPTQTVPGGQDLSRFATQGGPPQSTLASLGPQPQAGPPNPVLEMARTNPRAAMLLQGQLQQAQERQLNVFKTQLTMREKTAEAFASRLQGVNSQESYETAVQDLMQWAPQQASRLPKVWSKEAMQPIIASALSAKDRATLQIAELNEQTDLRKQLFTERQAAAGVPKYTEDSTLNVAIDRRMQQAGIPRGTPPPEAILTQAQRDVEEGKVRVSASHGTGQILPTATGFVRVNPRTNQPEQLQAPGGGPLLQKPTEAEQRAASYGDRAKAAHDTAVTLEEKGLTPGIWSKVGEALPFGLGNYLVGEDQQRYRQTVNQFAQAILRKESGAAISPTEYTMTERTYFPQPGDSKKVIDQKRQERERVIQSMQEEGKQTGRTGTQGQPTSQGHAKPVGQMSREELLAERDRLRKGGS